MVRKWITNIFIFIFPIVFISRYQILLINISLAFPEITIKQKKRLIRQTLRSNIFSTLSIFTIWSASENHFKNNFTITGLDHLHSTVAMNKPILILIPHMAHIEHIGAGLSHFVPYPLYVTYKPAHSKLMNSIIVYFRKKYYKEIIAVQNMHRCVSLLRKNKILIFNPDHGIRERKSANNYPFMNIPIAQWDTHLRLQKLTGAVMLPVLGVRLGLSDRIHIMVQPPITIDFSSATIDDQIHQSIQYVEKNIAYAPNQYLWIHRRFKNSARYYNP